MTTRVLMLSKACIVGIYQRKLEQIAAHGIDLLVVVPPTWKDERGVQPLERVYTQGYRLQTTGIVFNGSYHLHFYPALGRLIASFRPHIVHIDEEPYNLATWHALYLAHRAGARALFFTWQNIVRRYPFPFSWGERHVLRHADYAVAGTESAAAVLQAKGYTGPYRVIPQFGTDPELFHPGTARPADCPFTIGYIGRLVPEKGVSDLLRAAAQLPGEWCLRITGGGPQRDALAGLAQSLGIAERVTFSGQVASTQMPDRYRDLDVLVLPSLTQPNWKEQFGRVLVEAMASGVVVIGSDSGAIPDVIGGAGLVFPEGDVDALAAALRRVQSDAALWARLGEQGRERVLSRFTHEQVAAATVEVYRTMLRRS